MKYKVLDFVWVRGSDLSVHPEANVPIGADDKAAIAKSVQDGGLIQPLLVIPNLGDSLPAQAGERKKWWIVDGANRYAAVASQDRIPCVVVKLEFGVRVRDLALECASVGRSRSAGQRIMVYLERNKKAVLAAAEKGRDLSQRSGNFAKVSRDTMEDSKGFSSEEISKALGVSKVDTLSAIDLLRSHEERIGVEKRVGALVEEGKQLEEGDPELKAIDEAWAGVLAGTTPIRRWKAAVGGKRTTKEVQRAEVSWVLVGRDGLTKVRGALGKNWSKLTMAERMELLEMARDVAAELPQEVREVFAGASK